MKKVILISIAFMLFFASVKAQVLRDDSFTGSSMVIDSTIVNDIKLLIANDRLYSKGGIIETIVNQASQEKAERGMIEKAKATQLFIDNLNKAYQKYMQAFIKIDTLYVDSVKIDEQIIKIQKWQQSVLKDSEIKNATSLGIWEQKTNRLNKLLYYQKQLK